VSAPWAAIATPALAVDEVRNRHPRFTPLAPVREFSAVSDVDQLQLFIARNIDDKTRLALEAIIALKDKFAAASTRLQLIARYVSKAK